MGCELVDRPRRGASAALSLYPVRFACLFGSHAEGRARADSDVDVVLVDGLAHREVERIGFAVR